VREDARPTRATRLDKIRSAMPLRGMFQRHRRRNYFLLGQESVNALEKKTDREYQHKYPDVFIHVVAPHFITHRMCASAECRASVRCLRIRELHRLPVHNQTCKVGRSKIVSLDGNEHETVPTLLHSYREERRVHAHVVSLRTSFLLGMRHGRARILLRLEQQVLHLLGFAKCGRGFLRCETTHADVVVSRHEFILLSVVVCLDMRSRLLRVFVNVGVVYRLRYSQPCCSFIYRCCTRSGI